MDELLKKRIEDLINSHKRVLFMKGTPQAPMCGFSAQVASVLGDCEFTAYNILEDAELREGLKEYADWPTYPQLWVDGELVGGCDIIMELAQSDELAEALKT